MQEDDKKLEAPEANDSLHELGKEVQNLQDGIIENSINESIQNEKSSLDTLQNTIVSKVEKDVSLGDDLEKEKTLQEIKKSMGDIKKEITSGEYKPMQNTIQEILSPEVIKANQTASRKRIETKLVPIAGMPQWLVKRLNINNS